MKTEIFTLCDFAQDNGGKLTVVGTFDVLNLDGATPFVPPFYLAFKGRYEKTDSGETKATINIRDKVGVDIIPPMNVPVNLKMPDNTDEGRLALVAGFVGMKFVKEGNFRVLIRIGSYSNELPITIRIRKEAGK
jgi:hypothetical protein